LSPIPTNTPSTNANPEAGASSGQESDVSRDELSQTATPAVSSIDDENSENLNKGSKIWYGLFLLILALSTTIVFIARRKIGSEDKQKIVSVDDIEIID